MLCQIQNEQTVAMDTAFHPDAQLQLQLLAEEEEEEEKLFNHLIEC